MNNNKILILVTDLQLGGIQNYVRAQIKLLSELQGAVYTIVINETQEEESEYLISLNHLKSYQKPLFIKNFIRKNKINLLFDHRTKSIFIKGIIYDFLLRKTPKIQFVHSANLQLYFYSSHFLNRLLYQHTQLFVAVSKHIQHLVQQQINVPVEVVYYFFEPKSKATVKVENRNYLLFVGRFEDEVKDLRFLLQSYLNSGLHKKGIQFLLVGAGKDQDLILNFAKEHQLVHAIEIHPPVTDLEAYYQHAKAVVLASHFEGFPLVLLEALYHHTPVITTNFNPSVYEIVTPNKNGLVVDKKLDLFVESLKKIEEDTHYYSQLLENTQAPLPEAFSKASVKKRWLQILEKYF